MDINVARKSVAFLACCRFLTTHDSDALLDLLADHARLQADVLSMQEFIGPSLLSYWAASKKEAQP